MNKHICDQCKSGGRPGEILNNYTGDWVVCPHKVLDKLTALQAAALQFLKDYDQPRGQLAQWERADGKPLRKIFERLAKLVNYEWKERAK